jgi:hypothetical protein
MVGLDLHGEREVPMPANNADETLNALPKRVREEYLRIGVTFGSDRTVAVANQHIKGLAEHPGKLKGVNARMIARLIWARDRLIESGVGRSEKRIGQAALTEQVAQAIKTGKLERADLRVILEASVAALLLLGTADADAEADHVEKVLARTSRAADDAGPLADQLQVLSNTLARPAVRAVAEDDVDAELAEAQRAEQALRALDAQRAGPAGTPEETQRLDLLDGMVVTLVRQIARSAKAAARRLSDPALADVFSLDALYR